MMFPLWILQVLVIGGIALCAIGSVTLVAFLILDNKDNQIW